MLITLSHALYITTPEARYFKNLGVGCDGLEVRKGEQLCDPQYYINTVIYMLLHFI